MITAICNATIKSTSEGAVVIGNENADFNCLVRDAIEYSKKYLNGEYILITTQDGRRCAVAGHMRWTDVVYGGDSDRAIRNHAEAWFPEEFGICPNFIES